MTRAGSPLLPSEITGAAELVAHVIDAVAEHYGIPTADILSRQQTPRVVWCRQVAMTLSVELSGNSNYHIGRLFRLDGTTVRHARMVVARRCSETSQTAGDLNAVRELVKARYPAIRGRDETAVQAFERARGDVDARRRANADQELHLMIGELRRELRAAIAVDPGRILAALRRVSHEINQEALHG